MGLFKQKGFDAGEGTGSSRKVTRQANNQMKQAKLDTFEGNTNLEKKASMAAAKSRAKTAERKASKVVKKTERKEDRAAIVTARGDKRSNRKLAKAEKLTGKAGEIKAKSTAKAEKISPTKTRTIEPTVKKEESRAKKLTVKKTIEKVPTKRGTGVTYKSAWDADKGNVKSKYKTYAAFEKAAVAYNSRKDSKGVMSDKNKTAKGPKKKDGSY